MYLDFLVEISYLKTDGVKLLVAQVDTSKSLLECTEEDFAEIINNLDYRENQYLEKGGHGEGRSGTLKFKLLYGGDYNNYPIVLNDAEGLLLSYELGNGISLGKTNAACVRVYHAPQIDLTEEEKKQAVVIRAGIPFVVIGNGMTYLHQISPDKDWTLPDDYDGTQQISHIIPHWEYRKK